MTEEKRTCCSSPAAMCYWFAASLVAWGALSLIGIYWRPLHGSSTTTILFAMGIGCVANWFRNRTLHCAFTAPVFLIVRGKHPSRQCHFDLAIRPHWSRRSVSSGVALCRRRAPRPLEGERASDE